MDDYVPPLSGSIEWDFKGPPEYTPPLSGVMTFNFGVDDVGGDSGYLRGNYMILLTM